MLTWVPRFYVGSRDLHLGPYACKANNFTHKAKKSSPIATDDRGTSV